MIKNSLPPGPRGHWLTGCLHQFVHDRLNFMVETARTHGDISYFRMLSIKAFLVNHPDLIEKVLVTDSKYYVKHFGARLYKPILGDGLVTSEGDYWLRQRRLSQPMFNRTRLNSYAAPMVDLTRKMLDGWHQGQFVFINDELSKLTSAIALKTLFGLDAGEEREAYTDALHDAFALLTVNYRTFLRLPRWVPTPYNIRLNRALSRLNELVQGFIDKGRQRPHGDDLLSVLINARDEDGARMTDQQLRDEAMTLYLAGHETTALTLTWTWYLLAQHPEVEDLLLCEWRQVLNGRAPTVEDLPRLRYTEFVILEAMRLYPPVYLIGREATRDCELGGYRVKKGTTIFMSQWVTQRDPRFYSDPLAFKPERWGSEEIRALPKYAYFPFGGGPRICIGNNFAMMEAILLLATIGQQYRFTVEPGEIKLWPMITLLPLDGIPVVLERRPPQESQRLTRQASLQT